MSGLMVKEGSSITLTCSASGNPQPTVTWTKNGEQLQQGNSLTVYNINRFSAGEYTCTADNSIGSPVSAVITMDVLFPPVIETSMPQVLGGVGQRAELSCSVLAQPEAEISWFKNMNQVLNSENGVRSINSNSSHSTLVIYSMDEVDFGEYVCQGVNSLGQGRTNIFVSGTGLPPQKRHRIKKYSFFAIKSLNQRRI